MYTPRSEPWPDWLYIQQVAVGVDYRGSRHLAMAATQPTASVCCRSFANSSARRPAGVGVRNPSAGREGTTRQSSCSVKVTISQPRVPRKTPCQERAPSKHAKMKKKRLAFHTVKGPRACLGVVVAGEEPHGLEAEGAHAGRRPRSHARRRGHAQDPRSCHASPVPLGSADAHESAQRRHLFLVPTPQTPAPNRQLQKLVNPPLGGSSMPRSSTLHHGMG